MLNDSVIRTTFIISFSLHCLFLCIPGFNFSLSKDTKKSDEVIVNIEVEKQQVLPEIEETGKEKKLKEIQSFEPIILHKPQPEEIVLENSESVSLLETIEVINPAQEFMLRYQDIVRQKIEEKKEYSVWAKNQGIKGTVHLRFTISSNGQTDEIKIVKSSGKKILDQSAVNTVIKANPFPPLPEEIKTPYVQIELSFVYTLKEFK